MKKYLKTRLLMLLIILTPLSVFAEHTPYFKAIFGINKFNRVSNFNNLKQNSNYSPEIGIGGGVGYSFDDTFRGEVLITYTKLSFHNHCQLANFYDFHLNTKRVIINSTMFNIYKDFFNILENVKLFGGVGIGVSQINEIITWETISPNFSNRRSIVTNKGTVERKLVYNFTHSVIAGLDFSVSDRLNIDISYQYKNHGYTKSRKVYKMNLDQKLYINHSIYTGIRYNL